VRVQGRHRVGLDGRRQSGAAGGHPRLQDPTVLHRGDQGAQGELRGRGPVGGALVGEWPVGGGEQQVALPVELEPVQTLGRVGLEVGESRVQLEVGQPADDVP